MRHNIDICVYSLEKAFDELDNANILFRNRKFSKSLNCSYYAVFHATRALLSVDQLFPKKHTGVIALFIKNYVHEGIFDKRFGKIISQAQLFRMSSDYELFYIVSKDQANEQIEKAREFLNEIKSYLEKRLERSFKLPKIEDVVD